MDNYEFTAAKISRWIEKVGADIRPPIEIQLEQQHLHDFSSWARRELPQIFDRMVLGDQRFEMLKTLEYPGKPPVDIATFAMTPRGPVFVIPRRVSEVDLEPDLPKMNDVFTKCMNQFLKLFPTRRVIRVGKINEYIFDCERLSSIRLVAQRFSRLSIPEDGEVFIRFNMPDASCNRIFAIEPQVGKRQVRPGGPLETTGFGVKVTVDVNNRSLDSELGESDWMAVLNQADIYNREGIYTVLNSEGKEDIQ